jgi:hypothetical protein
LKKLFFMGGVFGMPQMPQPKSPPNPQRNMGVKHMSGAFLKILKNLTAIGF